MRWSAVAVTAFAVAVVFSQRAALAVTPVSVQDATFAAKAAQGGAAEVADAGQALRTSRNAAVDAFANHMVADHSKANARLAAIMRLQHIPQPANIGAENQAAYSRIEALTGPAFNAAYFDVERIAHTETIALFTQEIRLGHDPQLVGFAKSTLPIVRRHLAMLPSRE